MRIFVSGTDTEVGKTVVACSLLNALRSRGIPSLGMKPVAAGVNPQGLWDDVERIREAGSVAASIDDIAPYRLRAPASPHFAAIEDGISIRAEVILAALARLERICDTVVIEGVGGFKVPVSDHQDMADVARRIGAPVVLVVPMRLGCINHALLSAEAIAARGLDLLGHVANAGFDPEYARVGQTVDTISERTGSPCLGVIPRLADGRSAAGYLDVDRILARLPYPQLRRCS